ncbi:hypothetical protein CLAIMM_01401, partial [Cladophialophora immunda]
DVVERSIISCLAPLDWVCFSRPDQHRLVQRRQASAAAGISISTNPTLNRINSLLQIRGEVPASERPCPTWYKPLDSRVSQIQVPFPVFALVNLVFSLFLRYLTIKPTKAAAQKTAQICRVMGI